MRRIRTGLLGIAAFTLAATGLATGAASAAPAAGLASETVKCDPAGGSATFFSPNKWSKVNVQWCVKTFHNSDGTYAVQPFVTGDAYYYWGAAWYHDKAQVNGDSAFMGGTIATAVNGKTLASGSYNSGRTQDGTLLVTGARTQVPSGTFKVTFTDMAKHEGYWSTHSGGDVRPSTQVEFSDHTVEGTIP
ncbi:hypothetical protein GCM10010315_26280 [Streptomyces luteosporeus]|uniref:Uncharacterized protein n=2 Tax=Streptomyces TaxID=1883 RepID=A0ABP6G5Q8_9ACTN